MAAGVEGTCSSTSGFRYHVFLSFRGDTRKIFADHLCTALKRVGIHVFRDEDEIERGEVIRSEIENAIRESKMSLIVFSRDYASSSWCLDEVAMIMERREAVGCIVLPVFYDVDPSEVRKQEGKFGEAFDSHEKRSDIGTNKVEGWKSALRKVTELAGMVLQNRHEAQFIQDIVKKVGEKLNRTILHVPSYLVGIDSHVKDINIWIQKRPDDVGIAVVYGIPGVGKTTIAKTVFNLNFDRFNCWSFLKDVREISNQTNGLVQLQTQLLSDMLKGKTVEIRNADEGIIQIRYAMQYQRVLIVLDNVDDVHQFKSIIGKRDWLYKGSKVIITTRHRRLLSPHEVCEKFGVMPLDDKESLQLFSWHAFGQEHPIEDFCEDSKNVVHHCGGLPLALEVLGFSLSDRTIDSWKRAIKEPEAFGSGKIQKILQISYDSLPDDRDKTLFLDIACFFIGEDMDFIDRIVQGCEFYRNIGIQVLLDRYLISIDKNNKVTMHQLLRDMGREIVRQESPDDHGQRSRIWCHNDSFKILRKNTGSKSIKSFILDWKEVDIVSKVLVDLKTGVFANMSNLKLINLNHLRLEGSYNDFPKGLVWLCWRAVPWNCIPDDFYLEDLVVLDLCNSSLKFAWSGRRIFPELKILDLSHCRDLIRTPDFSELPKLEILIFQDCIKLVEVDHTIGNLQHLFFMSLQNCRNLRRLPKEMSMLKSLQKLILSGCSILDEIPNELQKFEFLDVIDVDGSHASSFQNWVSDLRFRLLRKSTLSIKPPMDNAPSFLVDLSLEDCNLGDDALQTDLSSLASLKYLDLSGNQFVNLPEGIIRLAMLKSLVLGRCKRLKSLPDLPSSLGRLTVSNFESLMLGPLEVYIFGRKEPDNLRGLYRSLMGNFNIEMIYGVSMFKSESSRIDQGNKSDAITATKGKTPIQVFHDNGITNIFLPVVAIPDWFHLLTGTSRACCFVPSSSYPNICGLNICAVYACDSQGISSDNLCNAKIRIVVNDKSFEYIPEIFGIPETNKDMLWLCNWTLHERLEAGNLVVCSIIMPSAFQVKKFGVHLVCQNPQQNPTEKESYSIQFLSLAENSLDQFTHTSLQKHSNFKASRREACKNYGVHDQVSCKSRATELLHHASTQLAPTSDEEYQNEKEFLNKGFQVFAVVTSDAGSSKRKLVDHDCFEKDPKSAKLNSGLGLWASSSNPKMQQDLANVEKYKEHNQEVTKIYDPYSIDNCMDELEMMEDVSNASYSKALEKFKDPDWRNMFIKMTPTRRKYWLESIE